MSAWGDSFGDAWGGSFGGAFSGVTISCTMGNATAQGHQATVTVGGSVTIACSAGAASASGFTGAISQDFTLSAGIGQATASGYQATISTAGSTTIACNVGQALAQGLQGSIVAGGVADTRLDQILALLTGTKIYDESTGLWRVYDSNGIEIADEGGVLFRGLHGWLLRQHIAVSEETQYIGGWDDKKPSKAQVEIERIRLGITKEKAKKLKKAIKLAEDENKSLSAGDKPLPIELIKEKAIEIGLPWESQFAIWLDILNKVRINARNNALERLTLQAFEEYEYRRMVEMEETDIVFLMTVLANEIYA